MLQHDNTIWLNGSAGRRFLPLWCAAVVALGCAGPHDATVVGIATLDGTPLERGTITFHPTDGGALAYVQLSPGGHYKLQTGGTGGLRSGKYRVTVVAYRQAPATEPGVAPPVSRPVSPDRYSNPETSGLVRDVSPSANQIDLALTRP